MVQLNKKPVFHIIFWVLVVIVLTLIFGRSWGNNLHAFYFTMFLLPVIMGTFYLFNYYLVPAFLLKRKHIKFILFTFYMFVVSLWLEIIVLTWSFVYLAEFDFMAIGPNASDTLILAVLMYLIVFLGAFFLMMQQLNENKKTLQQLQEEKEKQALGVLEIMSNRKMVRINYKDILFVESLNDAITLHLKDGETIGSKEKISTLDGRLPEQFLRIHRSFIINIQHIKQFNSNEVDLAGHTLNIGRSYKDKAMAVLRSAVIE